ncbi:hypothetical protein HPO96_18405 [Kribbella sandramycini]|uniref:Secreted protein n=1 Tax=Kribbella sandramycini TaxID=60450 RepID=A0A7Y4L2J4_9ACTN|nr:hypothetical protein [Kribbella sandramycini]MBB6564517.1 hypothetical protein [Kribbella sandramycini]NOL42221.1 hypothetical protein [Kribbella sandramycini]
MRQPLRRVVQVVGLGAALCLPMSSGIASADTIDSAQIALSVYNAKDPEAAFNQLSPAEQEEFAARMQTWTSEEVSSEFKQVEPTPEELAAMGPDGARAGGCWQQYKYQKWRDIGMNTGDTWMTAHWCHNGSRITSYRLSDQGGQGKLGIKYEGLGAKYANNVGWEVRQGQTFKFKIGWAHANPCMQIRGGKGLYSFRANCNMS